VREEGEGRFERRAAGGVFRRLCWVGLIVFVVDECSVRRTDSFMCHCHLSAFGKPVQNRDSGKVSACCSRWIGIRFWSVCHLADRSGCHCNSRLDFGFRIPSNSFTSLRRLWTPRCHIKIGPKFIRVEEY
jgi:hypothetical protein